MADGASNALQNYPDGLRKCYHLGEDIGFALVFNVLPTNETTRLKALPSDKHFDRNKVDVSVPALVGLAVVITIPRW
jgi:hypothetical protein